MLCRCSYTNVQNYIPYSTVCAPVNVCVCVREIALNLKPAQANTLKLTRKFSRMHTSLRQIDARFVYVIVEPENGEKT